ncbi:Isochorismatase-like protein [Stachybotrys elegans]|uniref:Isochorismatase-like protein n=1 Tax=Stachybotrys elegans TaxID=80388 RepID=A0A8K0WTK5_9HYPO|nr:Isochorismatase-like protein [Stachybotrys elegans]
MDTQEQNAMIIGGRKNFWIWSKENGFDITHPSDPDQPLIYPRITLATRSEQATLDPAKTALVVTDMQNYFLSPLLDRPPDSLGLKIVDRLTAEVIPACRKAGIRVVWLCWGLEDADLDDMPPSIARGYDFPLDKNFTKPRFLGRLGQQMGPIKLQDGREIEAGRVMMRDQCNTALVPKLAEAVAAEDIWVNKSRLSGFWGGTEAEATLRAKGITTLLFSGENTDQCVAASMQGSYTQGWDCLMLSDACATTSPDFATKCIEYNCQGGWGFVLSCKQLVDGINAMQVGPEETAA